MSKEMRGQRYDSATKRVNIENRQIAKQNYGTTGHEKCLNLAFIPLTVGQNFTSFAINSEIDLFAVGLLYCKRLFYFVKINAANR